MATGPVTEVLAAGRRDAMLVRVADPPAALAVLREEGMEAALDTGWLRVWVQAAQAARITEALAQRGLFLSELRPKEVSLESVFLELTGEEARGGSA